MRSYELSLQYNVNINIKSKKIYKKINIYYKKKRKNYVFLQYIYKKGVDTSIRRWFLHYVKLLSLSLSISANLYMYKVEVLKPNQLKKLKYEEKTRLLFFLAIEH